MATTSTRISRHVNAPRDHVYRALLDAQAVATWMVPSGMTSHVHEFDARVGGLFRISLTYDAPTGTGKTTAPTDTYHGHFVKLIPNEQVVEVMEFETADAEIRGEMTVTFHAHRCGRRHGCAWRTRQPASWRLARRQRNWLADGTRQTRGTRRGGPKQIRLVVCHT